MYFCYQRHTSIAALISFSSSVSRKVTSLQVNMLWIERLSGTDNPLKYNKRSLLLAPFAV